MDQEFPPILEFSKVNKVFRGKNGVEKQALKDLSLCLSAGMVVGLLGQNGAGKSTLMRCALGILSPDSGDIRTLGETPEQLSSAAKERLGYVPQQPFGYEGFTVERALDLHRSFYPHWDMQLEQDWLARFELDVSQQVQRLSVGQRQSLALIMAMAYRPELLILDEPVASLDPIVRRKFMVDLFDLALESGSAVLFSSHITSDLERVASHVALIKQGELVLFKEIDALREEVRLLKLAVGTELPEQVRILSRDGNSVLVDSGAIDLNLPGVQRSEALNLEQLFVELHK
ncbi:MULTISPECIES: ABC transporter ATP-binding protein [Shewanella]|jgi:ABC-2 type transport system ATP-binding protein|uniref:ABC transporter ATP-binding protein n=1 Tax=Shewanella TaxID=22 RepID=UPI00002D558E|nr:MULTISPECIES: ABC transporter ATP-binding protein [Shewanella]PZP37699.1 MAG: ABC transporter ATP-binding protein [Shewanella oneidensis]ASF16464.1 ABC transporter ATP-binding protein [Shewanella sp. FDAARGOS_354]MCD8549786.1 ABC transporter ATP-binding protein [Shewanella xiamenensis]MCD8558553.1 ABC transporter ATP-binding protein [Shewanella xiamenensis]MCH7422287.1 ABC transporter ATP-binding protein [Shewanella sp. MM_2022_3]